MQELNSIENTSLKLCSNCLVEKPISGFNKSRKLKDGLQSYCKLCQKDIVLKWQKNNKEKTSGYINKWRKNNPEKVRQHFLTFRYGINSEKYNYLRIKQNNKCAICNNDFTDTPHVDHNHITGKVRGLLCFPCNVAIGFLEADKHGISKLSKAIEYIRDSEMQ